MFASNNLSAADVAAVTGGRNNDGFGDGNGWWIILIALLFGWGRNGAFGGGYGYYGCQQNGYQSCGC